MRIFNNTPHPTPQCEPGQNLAEAALEANVDLDWADDHGRSVRRDRYLGYLLANTLDESQLSNSPIPSECKKKSHFDIFLYFFGLILIVELHQSLRMPMQSYFAFLVCFFASHVR